MVGVGGVPRLYGIPQQWVDSFDLDPWVVRIFYNVWEIDQPQVKHSLFCLISHTKA